MLERATLLLADRAHINRAMHAKRLSGALPNTQGCSGPSQLLRLAAMPVQTSHISTHAVRALAD
jgi:hypothetical protein